MTFVVTDDCILCKLTDCVEVCPEDCFHEGPNFLAIDPECCTDCAICLNYCDVNAIYADDKLPDEFQNFLALNAELSKQWPVITKKKDPLPEAKKWAGVKNKLQYLKR